MRSHTRQRNAASVALAVLALLFVSGRKLHPQAASNPRFDALVALTEAKMKEFGVPGVAIGIIDGTTMATRGLGITNVEDSVPVNAHTVFPIHY